MALSPEELSAAAADGTIDTVIVATPDLYGRLVGKRVDAGFFCDEVLDGASHACEYLFTVDMEMEVVGGYDFANWGTGFGDVHLLPDLSTLRLAGWDDATAIVLCDVVDRRTHQPVAVAPRTILRRQVDRLALQGFTAAAGSELEFYLSDESYRAVHEGGYREPVRAGWYSEDYHLLQGGRVEPYVGAVRRMLAATGIPVESSKGETGIGQHEINIRYADVLEMADRHVLMKHAMKELAEAQGVSVTFMAKPFGDDAGSSSHLHLSLWSTGENAFDDDGDESEVFRRFLGGWMAHVTDVMVGYAPTVNSYKRFADASWAPTRVSWSHDNRTAAFRVVGHGDDLRIECRIPGADCNPYLAYSAALASGIAGIERVIDPPDPCDGDAYSADLPPMPRSLDAAVDAFDESKLTRTVFGDDVVDHYAHFHRVEADAFRTAVTDWERRRYFERI